MFNSSRPMTRTLAALLLAGLSAGALAATHHVPADFATIPAAISAAAAGDTILVADGVYAGAITVSKVVTLQSENGPAACIIDCGGSGRGMTVSVSATIVGFTIRNGAVSGSGGGIVCSSSGSPTIQNCIIDTCTATGDGAGIFSSSAGTPVIQGCTISNCTAGNSGGGVMCSFSSPQILDCTITNNRANSNLGGAVGGGGIAIVGSNASVSGCTISSNSTVLPGGFGGGVLVTNGTCNPTFDRCTFRQNSALDGGGLAQTSTAAGTTRITSSLFTANSVAGRNGGAALFNSSSTLTLVGCTFTGNTAAPNGGALFRSGGPVSFTNCILWADTPTEIFPAGNANIGVNYSDIAGGWTGGGGTGNLNVDPDFVNPGSGDYHLSEDCAAPSPCIDVGNTAAVTTPTDLGGGPRIVNSIVDMGAYEAAAITPGPPVITCPADVTIECGGDTSPAAAGQATATGCGTITITFSDSSTAACGNTQTISRTWTATNDSASDSCIQTITVTDTTPPVLTVPVAIEVSCADTPGAPDPNDTGLATATDACGPAPTVAYSDSEVAGGCSGERVVTRTWTATDACNNAASATQVITVSNHAVPALTIPSSVTVNCGDSTDPSATGAATGSAACDSTPDITFADSTAPGACPGESVITRTWTITDDCGNTASAPQTITVADTTPPTLTLPADANVDCGDSTDPADTGAATATDACSGVQSISHSDVTVPGACTASYTIQRTWTAADCHGNPASAVQLITVSDSAGPLVTVPADATVECGDGTSPAYTGQATASDACSAVSDISWSDSVSEGACTSHQVRIITRTWTATDACGNPASGVQTITVVDNTPPALNVPPPATIACGDSTDTSITGAATASDGCDADPIVAFTDDTQPGVCPAVSVIMRNWTATDACGNVASGSQQISIVDNLPPIIECPPDVDVDLPPGHCSANVNIGFATATDQCSASTVTSNAPAVYPVGTTVVTWTATDACGNAATCTQNVTVQDSRPPFVMSFVGTTMLWPANHVLMPVGLTAWVSDLCDSGIEPVVTVYANEDDETPANGVYSPDARDIAPGTLRLRSERVPGGGGRVYLIIVTATDSSGNSASACSTVVVPENRGFFSLIQVTIRAIQAQAYFFQNNAPPPSYFPVGDGAVIGPLQ